MFVQMLLFLSVPLLHLLRLLLMALFHLLLLRVVGLLLGRRLMVLFLLLLELLVFLLLFGVELVLLLLIFLVELRIAGIRGRSPFVRLNFTRVGGRVSASSSRGIGSSSRRIVMSLGRRGFYPAAAKFSGLGSRGDRRFAVVHRSAELLVGARRLDVLILSGHRADVPVTRGGFFRCGGASVYAALSAVIADAIYGDVLDARVVDVVNFGDVDVVYGAVVEKVPVVPTTAFIAMAKVTEAVVNPTVKTDRRSPKTFVKNESRAAPAPPRWCPKETDFGSENPGAGNPVIVSAIPSPVTGRPDVAVAGAERLFVDG